MQPVNLLALLQELLSRNFVDISNTKYIEIVFEKQNTVNDLLEIQNTKYILYYI